MIQFSDIVYFWFTALFSIAFLFLGLFTMKRVGYFKKSAIVRNMLWSGVVLFLGVVLAGPKLNWNKSIPIKERVEIIFGLDVSLSTLARDVEINQDGETKIISRFEMEKQQVENAIGLLQTGDAVGITIFADRATPLQSILVREDYASILRNLRYIDSDFVRYRVRQGTDYGAFILAALEQFGEGGTKILFILTDGEPQGDEEKLRGNLSAALEEFSKRKNVSVYLLGVGDSTEPSKIPKVEDENGKPKEYYTDKNGHPILTRPNPEFLTNLANVMDGHYIHAAFDKNLNDIFQGLIESERRIIDWEKKTRSVDLTPYLLISSLFLLLLIAIIKSV